MEQKKFTQKIKIGNRKVEVTKDKKIPLSDSEYQKNETARAERHASDFFGESILNKLEIDQGYIESCQKSLNQYKDEHKHLDERSGTYNNAKRGEIKLSNNIIEAQKQLDDYLNSGIIKELFIDLGADCTNIINNNNIAERQKTALMIEVLQLIWVVAAQDDRTVDFLNAKNLEDLKNKYSQVVAYFRKGVFNEEGIKMLIHRKEYIHKQEEELTKKVEVYKKQFVSSVGEKVKQGELPNNTLDNLDKIDNVKIKLVDWFENIEGHTAGWVHSETGGVIIDNRFLHSVYEQDLKHIVYHELVHIINGISVNSYHIKDITEDDEDFYVGGAEMKVYQEVKMGLLLRSGRSHLNGKNRIYNTWLNEATTELITLILLEEDSGDYSQSIAYRQELLTLAELFRKGLSRQNVIGAYFENITNDQPIEERGKKLGELIKGINKINPGEYVRLNNKFVMVNLESRLKKLGLYTKQYLNDNKIFAHKPVVIFKFQAGLNKNTQSTQEFVFSPEVTTNKLKNVVEEIKLLLPKLKNIRGIRLIDVKIEEDK